MANSIYNGTFVLGNTSATTLSAGPGITLDTSVPGVIGISNDETVLWEGTRTSACDLSESVSNFEKLSVFLSDFNGKETEVTVHPTSNNFTFPTIAPALGPNQAGVVFRFITVENNTMTVTKAKCMSVSYNDATTAWTADTNEANVKSTLTKVIGVNRKQTNGGV